MKRKLLIGLTVAALVFLLTGCNDEEVEVTEPEEQEEEIADEEETEEIQEPQYGGTLELGSVREESYHPYGIQSRESKDVYHFIFEGLMALDEEMEPRGQIARDYEVGEDGQSITFNLREDLQWHDGEEFTLQDLRFTLRWLREADSESLSPEGKNAQRVAKQITDAREFEDGRVEVIFSRPFSNGLDSLTFWVLPQHIFEGREMNEITTDYLVGSGPFKVSSGEIEEGLSLGKIENHPMMDSYIEEIHLRWFEDDETLEAAFQEREIDFLRAEHYGYMDSEEFETLYPLGNHYEFLAFNHRDENVFTKEPELRRILSQLIDREELIDASYHGFGEAASIPIHPHHYLFEDTSQNEDREELLGLWEEHLNRIGYQLGEDHLYETENNEVLRLRILVDEDRARQINSAMILAREFMELGVEVILEQRSDEEIIFDLDTGNYQSYLGAWTLSPVSDLSFAFHSTQVGHGNIHFYQSDGLDALIEDAFRAPDREMKMEKYRQIIEYLNREQPGIGLYFLKEPVVISQRVMGVDRLHPNNALYYMEEWFLESR